MSSDVVSELGAYMHLITIYVTPHCPYCKQLKNFFDEQGIRYEEIDVAASDEAREALKQKSGALAVPVVDIDGTIIIGFDLPKIEAMLDNRAHA